MKLSFRRKLGRYSDTNTGKAYNVYIAKNTQRGTDHIFYYFRNKRMFINDADFYHNYEEVKGN